MKCACGNLLEPYTWQPAWTVHVATSMNCARATCMNRTRGNPVHGLDTWQPAMMTIFCFKFVFCIDLGFFTLHAFVTFFASALVFLSLFCIDMNQWAVVIRSSLFWQISWLVAAAPGPPPTLWNQRMRKTCWIVGFSAHQSTSSCTRIFRSAS